MGYFPDPYPDELFYSICARFAERMSYSPTIAARALSLPTHASVGFFLPYNLDLLAETLPPRHSYTADSFIDGHSILPYWGPFMQSATYSLIRGEMKKRRGQGALAYCGYVGPRYLRQFIRYCPKCVSADRGRWGEAYWHRQHQIPGVLVCETHSVFLLDSELSVATALRDKKLLSAESCALSTLLGQLQLSDTRHCALLAIARDVDWLLHAGVPRCPEAIRTNFLELLKQNGFVRKTIVKRDELRSAIIKRYSSSLLCELCSSIGEPGHIVDVAKLYRAHISVRDPINQLVLMHFLGHTAQSFFATIPAIMNLSPDRSGVLE